MTPAPLLLDRRWWPALLLPLLLLGWLGLGAGFAVDDWGFVARTADVSFLFRLEEMITGILAYRPVGAVIYALQKFLGTAAWPFYIVTGLLHLVACVWLAWLVARKVGVAVMAPALLLLAVPVTASFIIFSPVNLMALHVGLLFVLGGCTILLQARWAWWRPLLALPLLWLGILSYDLAFAWLALVPFLTVWPDAALADRTTWRRFMGRWLVLVLTLLLAVSGAAAYQKFGVPALGGQSHSRLLPPADFDSFKQRLAGITQRLMLPQVLIPCATAVRPHCKLWVLPGEANIQAIVRPLGEAALYDFGTISENLALRLMENGGIGPILLLLLAVLAALWRQPTNNQDLRRHFLSAALMVWALATVGALLFLISGRAPVFLGYDNRISAPLWAAYALGLACLLTLLPARWRIRLMVGAVVIATHYAAFAQIGLESIRADQARRAIVADLASDITALAPRDPYIVLTDIPQFAPGDTTQQNLFQALWDLQGALRLLTPLRPAGTAIITAYRLPRYREQLATGDTMLIDETWPIDAETFARHQIIAYRGDGQQGEAVFLDNLEALRAWLATSPKNGS